MSSVLKKVLAATSVFSVYLCLWLSTPVYSHVIGGTYNTDFYQIRRGQAAVSSESAHHGRPRRRYADDTRRLNVGLNLGRVRSHHSRQQNHHLPRHRSTNTFEDEMFRNALIELLYSPSRGSLNPRSRRAILGGARTSTTRPPAVSTTSSSERTRPRNLEQSSLHGSTASGTMPNPFLRMRRDAASSSETCSMPTDLPEQVAELNTFLTNSTYIGVFPQQDGHTPVPTNQPPNSCPSLSDSWWPRQEVNLRSTCPWIWEEIDLGLNAFPRKLHEAKCICSKCIGANSYRCQKLHQDVTYLRKIGCQNGVALMEKDVKTITVGCFCAAPAPHTSANQSASGSNSSDALPNSGS